MPNQAPDGGVGHGFCGSFDEVKKRRVVRFFYNLFQEIHIIRGIEVMKGGCIIVKN